MVVRLLRVTAIVLVLLAALVATAVVVLETGWAKNRLRELAIRQAERQLTGELRIGRLTGSLFTGVALHDVSLTLEPWV